MRIKQVTGGTRRLFTACTVVLVAVFSTAVFGQGGSSTQIVFPQIAAGPAQVGEFSGTFSTSILLLNPGGSTANTRLEFTNISGKDMPVEINGSVGSQVDVVIAGGGVLTLEVESTNGLSVGAARVNSDQAIQGQVLYRFTLDDGTVRAEAGIEAPVLTNNFFTYLDTRGGFNTGVAIFNPGFIAATVGFELWNEQGDRVAIASVLVQPFEQISRQGTDLFPGVNFTDFVGTIRGSITGNINIQLGVTALRYNSNLDVLSSLPVGSQ